ncbi:MAG TPA: hypothetical protein VFU47_02825 [Armatimonadota bacterium]|nr:hypothetical protein [Armatimonadota bacterium]
MADAKLIIKPPHMEVRMKPGFWPDLPRMQQTIKDAGYQPILDRTELVVTGKVVKQADGLALEVDRLKSPVTLRIVPSPDDPDTAAHLAEKHVGQTATLQGLWHAPAAQGGPASLAVAAILDAKGGKEVPH